jgi:small subunit ribosomal protein S20
MPVIKSAKKKLRKDIKREKRNDVLRISLSKTLKEFKKNPSDKLLSSTVKAIDKASKNHIIHKNKAARIKSKISKLVVSKTKVSKPIPTTSKKPKKASK